MVLEEMYADTTFMVSANAVTDEQAMPHAMNNGVTAPLSLLPSGLVILPDGASPIHATCSSSTIVNLTCNIGLLISHVPDTTEWQELEETSLEAIDNAGNLPNCVINNTKDAIHANNMITAWCNIWSF
jgi:hypothetical protein